MSASLTGVPINTDITKLETELSCSCDNKQLDPSLINDIHELNCNVIEATKAICDFKEQATEGLLDCKITSIALPLLADHILREANHYLILLHKYDANI